MRARRIFVYILLISRKKFTFNNYNNEEEKEEQDFFFMFRLLMSWEDVHVSLNFYFAIAFVFT